VRIVDTTGEYRRRSVMEEIDPYKEGVLAALQENAEHWANPYVEDGCQTKDFHQWYRGWCGGMIEKDKEKRDGS
jgi:hypothetical protein